MFTYGKYSFKNIGDGKKSNCYELKKDAIIEVHYGTIEVACPLSPDQVSSSCTLCIRTYTPVCCFPVDGESYVVAWDLRIISCSKPGQHVTCLAPKKEPASKKVPQVVIPVKNCEKLDLSGRQFPLMEIKVPPMIKDKAEHAWANEVKGPQAKLIGF